MRPAARIPQSFALGLLAFASCAPTGGSICDDLSNACGTVPAPSQYLADLRQDDVTRRPAQGTAVHLQQLSVAAIDAYSDRASNRVGNIYLEQYVSADELAGNPHFDGFTGCAPYMGGAMCGIQVFGATVIPVGTHLIPGDIVNANGGSYDEFTCQTCSTQFDPGHSLPELAMVDLERIGSASTPVIVPVTLADLMAHSDDYIGVLVTIDSATPIPVTQDSRGNLSIGSFALTNDLSPLTDVNGTTVDSSCDLTHLTGIVSYFYGPQFLPRSPRDIEIAPGTCSP